MSAVERAYAAADAWRALAEAAQDALAEAGSAANALTSNNRGAAVEAFERTWRALADPAFGGSLPRLVHECALLAERCEQYAVRSAEAQCEAAGY